MNDLDWSNSSYVRVYIRGMEPFEAVSELVGCPNSAAKKSLEKIFSLGFLIHDKDNDSLFDPQFLYREEASMSDRQRQKESRHRRKDRYEISQNVTPVTGNVTEASLLTVPCSALHCPGKTNTAPEVAPSGDEMCVSLDKGEAAPPQGSSDRIFDLTENALQSTSDTPSATTLALVPPLDVPGNPRSSLGFVSVHGRPSTDTQTNNPPAASPKGRFPDPIDEEREAFIQSVWSPFHDSRDECRKQLRIRKIGRPKLDSRNRALIVYRVDVEEWGFEDFFVRFQNMSNSDYLMGRSSPDKKPRLTLQNSIGIVGNFDKAEVLYNETEKKNSWATR